MNVKVIVVDKIKESEDGIIYMIINVIRRIVGLKVN